MGQESYKHKTHEKHVKLKHLLEGFYAVSAHILEFHSFFFIAIPLRANQLHINLNPSASFFLFPSPPITASFKLSIPSAYLLHPGAAPALST